MDLLASASCDWFGVLSQTDVWATARIFDILDEKIK